MQILGEILSSILKDKEIYFINKMELTPTEMDCWLKGNIYYNIWFRVVVESAYF